MLDKLRSMITQYVHDNYLQTPRFYIVTGILFLFTLAILFVYATVMRLDPSAFPHISPEGVALLLLGVSVLIVLISVTLFRFSGDIPFEYALYAAAIWFGYNSITQDSCLCCTTLSASGHDHGEYGAPSLLDAVNHRLVDGQAGCSDPTLIKVLHNTFVLVLLFMHYVVILVDRDYFRLNEQAEERIRERRQDEQRQKNVDTQGDALEEVSVRRMGVVHWARVLLLIILLGFVAVPLACNSVPRLTLDLLLVRILLVLTLVLLRLVNTYQMRYNHIKTAGSHVELVAHRYISQELDARYADIRIGGNNSDQQQQSVSEDPMPSLTQQTLQMMEQWQKLDMRPQKPITASERFSQVRDLLQQKWPVQCLVDIVIANLAFVLCDWFLIAAGVQVLLEVVLLVVHVSYFSTHLSLLTNIFVRRKTALVH